MLYEGLSAVNNSDPNRIRQMGKPRLAEAESLDPRRIQLMTGRTNIPLAESVKRHLEMRWWNEFNLHYSAFSMPDGETGTTIPDVRNKDVFIIQPTGPRINKGVVEIVPDVAKEELVQMARGSLEAGAERDRVFAIVPYMSYSRSDKKPTSGRGTSNLVLAVESYRNVGDINRLYTFDMHSEQTHLLSGGEWIDKSPASIFAREIRRRWGDVNLGRISIVGADQGASEKAEAQTLELGLPLTHAANLVKKRVAPDEIRILGIEGDIGGDEVWMLDDILSTAKTLRGGIDWLHKNRGVNRVNIVVTHALWIDNALDRLLSSPQVGQIITTNSVMQPDEVLKLRDRITVIDLGGPIADIIYSLHTGQSVRELRW